MREHYSRSLCLFAVPLLLGSACATELTTETSGVADSPEVAALAEPLVQPVDTITLPLTADTSIRNSLGNTNRNYGTQSSIALSRGLVMVDQTTLATATEPLTGDYILSAKLRFTVNSTLLLGLPRVLSAHRVLKSWTESAATWNCAVDANTANSNLDCAGATRWSNAGGDFVAAATGSAVLPLTLGPTVVEIDVSEDVREFKLFFDNEGQAGQANFGWVLKTLLDVPLDLSTIASRESATPPQLVLTVRRCNQDVCDDGIFCSQDGICGLEGRCIHLEAPPGSPCNDNNVCTTMDGCSGTDFSCVGTPRPVGTPCGSGLACDAQQQCVPSPG